MTVPAYNQHSIYRKSRVAHGCVCPQNPHNLIPRDSIAHRRRVLEGLSIMGLRVAMLELCSSPERK